MSAPANNSRLVAAQALIKVLPLTRKQGFQGGSLTEALERSTPLNAKDQALVQALCFGVCREYTRLDQLAAQLVRQPFKAKDADLQALLLLGIYQLYYLRTPDHAAIAETVEAVRDLQKTWAVKVLNAMLRNAQRNKAELESKISQSLAVQFSHPQWLIDMLAAAWPKQLEKILAANNQPGPMSLRVNLNKHSRASYGNRLNQSGIKAAASNLAASALVLENPVAVQQLPDFDQGACFVQDEAAQLAASLLDPQPGDRVLDACAAPGGKTTHLLEYQSQIKDLVAVDQDQQRLAKIRQNLQRLQLQATLINADILRFVAEQQQQGLAFERILLDAPCSATGVIRRHPDIKWLRKRGDIATLAKQQLAMLQSCWQLLQPGGVLLYATCSILPQENERIINQFLKQQPDVKEIDIELPQNNQLLRAETLVGCQLLPFTGGHDGFYYAKLQKQH